MQLFTVGEAAKQLDLSTDSIRRLEREGILTAIRVGKGHRLFTQAEIERVRLEREKTLKNG